MIINPVQTHVFPEDLSVFLGAFVKSDCWFVHDFLYVSPFDGTIWFQMARFIWNLMFNILKNLLRKFNFHLNLTWIAGINIKSNIHLCWYIGRFFLEWNILQTTNAVEIKIHTLSAIFFDRKSTRLRDNVEETWYSQTGHRWYLRACALHAG
jgi:hypothetical protein